MNIAHQIFAETMYRRMRKSRFGISLCDDEAALKAKSEEAYDLILLHRTACELDGCSRSLGLRCNKQSILDKINTL